MTHQRSIGAWALHSAACAVGVAGSAASGEVLITSGFEDPSQWVGHFISVAGTLNIPSTGGNPGRYADLGVVLQDNTMSATGFRRQLSFTLGSEGITGFTLAADYRWFDGIHAELTPFLLQNGLVYLADAHLPLGQSPDWVAAGELAVPIADFAHWSGTPLSPNLLTSAGFFVRLRSSMPTSATAHFGIDNVTIHLVPAPACLGVLATLAVCGRRRRAAAEVKSRAREVMHPDISTGS